MTRGLSPFLASSRFNYMGNEMDNEKERGNEKTQKAPKFQCFFFAFTSTLHVA
jgi:hypothetical protein